MTVTWKSLLAKKSFETYVNLVTCLPKSVRCRKHKHGVDTAQKLWTVVVHLFNACFHGKHPARDPWNEKWPTGEQQDLGGKVLAGGRYFLVVWHLAADREHHVNEWGARIGIVTRVVNSVAFIDWPGMHMILLWRHFGKRCFAQWPKLLHSSCQIAPSGFLLALTVFTQEPEVGCIAATWEF